mgnify:CR=1 FL=1
MLESPATMHTDNTPPTESRQPHIVSVRSLVEFVLQAGDLTPGGFQRRDRAQLGTQGHKRVQRFRPAGYSSEVEIRYRVEGAEPPLEVQGRIDGIYIGTDPVILEEIKTTTLSLDLVSEEHNRLHWAQAQCYGYMYARLHDLSGISIHLTYYHLDSQAEKTFARHFTLAELETFFHDLITPYLAWFGKLRAWQVRRVPRGTLRHGVPRPCHPAADLRRPGAATRQGPGRPGREVSPAIPSMPGTGLSHFNYPSLSARA